MKRRRLHRVVFLSWLCISLLWSLTSISAQEGNLLTNPGFEPPFVAQGGEPVRQVAQGWLPWNVAALPGMSLSENVQPEYYPASDNENGLGIERVFSGTDAQQYFTFFATHRGGVYQRVTGVTAGTALRFSINAYIWSTSFDDVNVSEQDGSVSFEVGIDPTGGTDGTSTAIVWSAPVFSQYDAFDQYTVTATAAGSAVSVWVRSSVSFPVKSNVIYLDDAFLGAATGVPATPVPATGVPATAVPPTGVPASATPIPPTAAPSTLAPVPPTAVPATATIAQPTTVPATSTSQPPTVPPTQTLTPSITFTPSATATVDTSVFPGTIIHLVRRGDTVSQLAALYGSSIQAIISANGLNANGLIFVGQALVIPVRLINIATGTPIAKPTLVTVPTQVSTTIILPTLVAPATAPPTLPPAVTTVPTAVPPTGVSFYIVQPGETLSQIAVRFRTTTSALAQLNGIVNPNIIFYGQRLRVPAPIDPLLPTAVILLTFVPGANPTPVPTVPTLRTYRVLPGDTLYKITLQYGVTLSRIIQLNGILDPNRIYVGQIIVIPNS